MAVKKSGQTKRKVEPLRCELVWNEDGVLEIACDSIEDQQRAIEALTKHPDIKVRVKPILNLHEAN